MISLPVESERLRIRPFDPNADAEAMYELWGDPEAMQFVRPDRAQLGLEDVRERLEETVARNRDGWGFWALEERAGGAVVGGTGLFPLAREGPEIELAYHVVPSRWGRGYATEAGAALLDAAWRETDLDQVVAVAFDENRASTRVMEKLGMTHEGPSRYREFEVVRYSIQRP